MVIKTNNIDLILADLGYNINLEKYRKDQGLDSFRVGRVVSEHKDRYIVKTDSGEFNSELIGNLRFTAENRSDLPAVGDWVAISEYDEEKALIHSIYPRYSIIERMAVGKYGQKQIIAVNIDYALIVQSVNRDFSINRLERYLTICNTSKVEPIIILSKIDLIDNTELKILLKKISDRIKNVPVIAISNKSLAGLEKLTAIIHKSKTYCLLGSSGVGKSTLINKLTGSELMNTRAINKSIDRGKHVTSHRELIVLENGGILIDNPGLREVGITDNGIGLDLTFDSIVKLSKECKFKDCSHINEKGCAILEAIETGEIDKDSYENFQKLQREKAHYESSIRERRKKDKDFGKMIKNYKKDKNQSKY